MKKLTTEEFIEKARKVHGGKYDYSKVEYVNNSTKVCIVCSEHGDFWMRPKNHMRGDSCPICARKEVGVANSISHEEFIERVGVLYGGKYDYSKTNYERMHVKVCVICPIHGEFWVTPACIRCDFQVLAQRKICCVLVVWHKDKVRSSTAQPSQRL